MNRGPATAAVIRSAEPGDATALSAVAKATYTETFGPSMTPAALRWQLEHTRSEGYFRDRLGKDAILVAVADGGIVGYVQVTDISLAIEPALRDGQQLNALYVRREYQGRGIGRRLMDAALELPRVRSAAHLFLDVWNENARALAFYTRYGFAVIGACDVVVDAQVIGKDLVMQLSPQRRGQCEAVSVGSLP